MVHVAGFTWTGWQESVEYAARQLRPHALRFARVLLWLMMEVARHYRLLRTIPVYYDLSERAQTFGIVSNH